MRRANLPTADAAAFAVRTTPEADAAALWSLGLGEPFTVSALHGRGVADLLDEVVAKMPEVAEAAPRAWKQRGDFAQAAPVRWREFVARLIHDRSP